MEKLRLQLRAVFYKESDLWIAHCLEMDVMGHGKTQDDAVKMLAEAITMQIGMSVANNNRANIFQPADARLFEMFAAGRDVAAIKVEFVLKREKVPIARDVVVEDFEAREYQGGCLAMC